MAMTWKLKDWLRKSPSSSEPSETDPLSASTSDDALVDDIIDQTQEGEVISNETQPSKRHSEEKPMSKTDITNLNDISGFIGACLVDTETGLL